MNILLSQLLIPKKIDDNEINDDIDITDIIEKNELEIQEFLELLKKSPEECKPKQTSAISEIKTNKLEFIDHSREFKDLCTDIVTFDILSWSGLYDFMYLIYKFHEYALRLFTEYFDLDSNDIIFIFKGGNILKLISSEFYEKLPGGSQEYFSNNFNKYFKKSDLDYGLYINHNLEEYDKIHHNVTLFCYFLQKIFITNIVLKNKTKYFQWFRYNILFKKTIFKKYLHEFKQAGCLEDENNEMFYNAEIIGLDFLDTLVGKSDNANYQLRKNQKIHFQEYGNINSPIIVHDIDEAISNFLYVSYNEALEFTKNDQLLKFNLIRTKINFNIIYKKDNNIFRKSIGGELIDVSIAHRDDKSTILFYDNKDLYLQQLNLHNMTNNSITRSQIKNNFTMYTYSLIYQYKDIRRILFEDSYYPWDDRKYTKRLYRLFCISFIRIFIISTAQWSVKIDGKFKNYNINTNKLIETAYSKRDSSVDFKVKNVEYYIIFDKSNQYNKSNNLLVNEVRRTEYEYREKYIKKLLKYVKSILDNLYNKEELTKILSEQNLKIDKTQEELSYIILDSITLLEKVLLKYDMIDTCSYTCNTVYKDNPEENKVTTIKELETYLNTIIDNLTIFKTTLDLMNDYCKGVGKLSHDTVYNTNFKILL